MNKSVILAMIERRMERHMKDMNDKSLSQHSRDYASGAWGTLWSLKREIDMTKTKVKVIRREARVHRSN